jgi:hypothetical protein
MDILGRCKDWCDENGGLGAVCFIVGGTVLAMTGILLPLVIIDLMTQKD